MDEIEEKIMLLFSGLCFCVFGFLATYEYSKNSSIYRNPFVRISEIPSSVFKAIATTGTIKAITAVSSKTSPDSFSSVAYSSYTETELNQLSKVSRERKEVIRVIPKQTVFELENEGHQILVKPDQYTRVMGSCVYQERGTINQSPLNILKNILSLICLPVAHSIGLSVGIITNAHEVIIPDNATVYVVGNIHGSHIAPVYISMSKELLFNTINSKLKKFCLIATASGVLFVGLGLKRFIREYKKNRYNTYMNNLRNRLGDDFLCNICLTNLKEIILVPCNHYTLCKHCYYRVNNCPICRTDIEEYKEVTIVI